jgi:PD-(D/E)XK nuclease superfamily
MSKLLISRSAILTYQTCNRKFYYQYAYNNHGVIGNKLDLDLLVGECIHRGLQHLLEHCRINHPNGDFDITCIDEAVNQALDLHSEKLSRDEIGLHYGEDVGYVLIEHRNLIEGLIRTYALKRLPNFLDEYEVLEVEKEDSLSLGNDILFLGKADGLLRRKSDNKLVVLSYKTCSEYSDSLLRDIQHDMQGVSEIVIIKERLNYLFKNLSEFWRNGDEYGFNRFVAASNTSKEVVDYLWWAFNSNLEKIEVNLVQYEHLVKGKRREDPIKSGIYKRQSVLLHPYKHDIGFNIKSGILDETEYKWKMEGRPPKDWIKSDIWLEMPIQTWIDILNSGKIQPEYGNPLDDLVRVSDLVYRSNDEQIEWLDSVRYMTGDIVYRFELLNNMTDAKPNLIGNVIYNNSLAVAFPKNTQQCHNYYGKDCMFVDYCHNGLDMSYSLENGLVQIRKPHHDTEKELFKERGFLKDDNI